MADWIAKKDLLQETGISYGQLYRWKRKGLIPESWFVRRATFTGQETFFPRAAILERIRWIQGMKPDIPLDDLAMRIHEPEQSLERFPLDVLWKTLQRVSDRQLGEGIKPLDKRTVTRTEFLAFLAHQYLRREGYGETVAQQLGSFIESVPIDWLEYPSSLLLADINGDHGRFLIVQSKEVVWWGDTEPNAQMSLHDLWNQVKSVWSQAETVSQRGM